MKKYLIELAVVILTSAMLTLGLSVPANAQTGGNFQCSAGSRQIPGSVRFCIQTQWHTVTNGKVKMDRVDVWISGDASQLEGGTCGNLPAANYNMRIESPTGTILWNPAANCLTKATGYADAWTTSLDGVAAMSPNARLISSFTLRDNGGQDSTGFLNFTVD